MSAMTRDARLPAWRRWLPSLGMVAALLTTACCVGLPAVVSLMSAAGAGFLLTDRYLQPLLVIVLLITVGASALTFWRHRNPAPLIITAASGAIVYWFIYRSYLVPIVWVGVAAMIGAQVWDVLAVRACAVGRGPSGARTGVASTGTGGT